MMKNSEKLLGKFLPEKQGLPELKRKQKGNLANALSSIDLLMIDLYNW